MLICPKCSQELNKTNSSYKCNNNHCFDIAKSGYVNLLLASSGSGDNKKMVDARYNFLSKGYYYKLAKKISDMLSSYLSDNDVIIDGGCGTGYYDNVLKQKYPNIIGFDISKYAIDKAAKLNKDLLYIVASGKKVPISSNSCSCIINIFSPTFPLEAKRLLNNNGIMIIVTPKDNHLIELKNIIYDKPYLNPNNIENYEGFEICDSTQIEFKENLIKDDIFNLLEMTPYLYKTKEDDLLKINKILSLDITFSFNITIYKKKSWS